jgi:Tfp pilus assembly protein PilV
MTPVGVLSVHQRAERWAMFRESVRREEGFSVAEVVIAAAILFFVLTAVVGLIGASQTMSVMAKDRTTLTNATAEYIDKIRALDFYDIDTPPSGLVTTSEEVTYGAYTISFTNRVVMPDGEGGKYLRSVYIQAETEMRGRTYRTSAVVHIKNPNNDTTAATIVDGNVPTVWFTDETPDENAIVFADRVWLGEGYSDQQIELEAGAESSDDTIADMAFAGAGTFTPSTFSPDNPASLASGWDTSAVADGLEKVVIQATDSQGRIGMAQRQFIVDNVAPAAPGVPEITTQTSTRTGIRFDAAPDPAPEEGQQPVTFAAAYWNSLRKSPSTGGADPWYWEWLYGVADPAGPSLIDSIFTAGPINKTIDTDSYSRYYLRLRGVSPRGLRSTVVPFFFVSPLETHSVSPYLSTCTTEYVSKVGTTYVVTVYLSKPTFPVSSVTYTYHAKPTGGSWSTFTPTGTPVITDVGSFTKIDFTYTKSIASESLWFKIGANVTPSDGLGAAYVVSNAIGRAPLDPDKKADTAVTGALSEASWTE